MAGDGVVVEGDGEAAGEDAGMGVVVGGVCINLLKMVGIRRKGERTITEQA